MSRWRILAVVAALATVIPLAAAPHECSATDFEGRYGFQGIGFNTLNYPSTPMALAGSIVADGKGKITYWRDFVHFGRVAGPPKDVEMNDFVAIVASGGGEVTYTVESDCRMVIAIPLPGPAPTLMLQGSLVDGGRTAQLLIGSPAYVGTWTARKADNPLGDDFELAKELIRRLARRQGVLGREEE